MELQRWQFIAVLGLNMGDKQRIRQLNILTYLNAKRFIIANNKGLIENIVKRVKSKILKTKLTKWIKMDIIGYR